MRMRPPVGSIRRVSIFRLGGLGPALDRAVAFRDVLDLDGRAAAVGSGGAGRRVHLRTYPVAERSAVEQMQLRSAGMRGTSPKRSRRSFSMLALKTCRTASGGPAPP